MTTTYEDDAVSLDERGITIKNYLYPGNRRLVPYETITSTEVIELGALSGRHRLERRSRTTPPSCSTKQRSRAELPAREDHSASPLPSTQQTPEAIGETARLVTFA